MNPMHINNIWIFSLMMRAYLFQCDGINYIVVVFVVSSSSSASSDSNYCDAPHSSLAVRSDGRDQPHFAV